MKSSRQNEIISIIETTNVETQEELRQALRARGFNATQATISRDIKQLHLVKERSGGGHYHYARSNRKRNSDVEARLRTIFKESVTSFDVAQNIVVVNTMPGLASAACSALDSMEIDKLVGTLAGDDTAILIMRTNDAAAEFCSEIHNMLN